MENSFYFPRSTDEQESTVPGGGRHLVLVCWYTGGYALTARWRQSVVNWRAQRRPTTTITTGGAVHCGVARYDCETFRANQFLTIFPYRCVRCSWTIWKKKYLRPILTDNTHYWKTSDGNNRDSAMFENPGCGIPRFENRNLLQIRMVLSEFKFSLSKLRYII